MGEAVRRRCKVQLDDVQHQLGLQLLSSSAVLVSFDWVQTAAPYSAVLVICAQFGRQLFFVFSEQCTVSLVHLGM